jgi:hypothetical protein
MNIRRNRHTFVLDVYITTHLPIDRAYYCNCFDEENITEGHYEVDDSNIEHYAQFEDNVLTSQYSCSYHYNYSKTTYPNLDKKNCPGMDYKPDRIAKIALHGWEYYNVRRKKVKYETKSYL